MRMMHIITKKSANFAPEHLGHANKVFRLTRGGRKIGFEPPKRTGWPRVYCWSSALSCTFEVVYSLQFKLKKEWP